MVLVSLSRRRFRRRRLCLLIACFAGTAISGFAQSAFLAVDSTPYDRQMARVQSVLLSKPHYSSGDIQLVKLNQWMSNLREIPYQYSKKWKTPAEVKSARVADCKGKAVILYDMMRANGARKVRVIIGKHRAEDRLTHAWVEWETKNGTYLLDPTFESRVAQASRYPSTYIPFYAYEGRQKYRASSALFAGGTGLKTAPPALSMERKRRPVPSRNFGAGTGHSVRWQHGKAAAD